MTNLAMTEPRLRIEPRESDVLRLHLRVAGVSLALELNGRRTPAVLHWGADLGDLGPRDLRDLAVAQRTPAGNSAVDEPSPVTLLPEGWTGWMGRPGITGHRRGNAWSPKFLVDEVLIPSGYELSDGEASGALVTGGAGILEVRASDPIAGLRLRMEIELLQGGLVRARNEIANAMDQPYTLDALAVVLPIPSRAREVLDFAGRWGKERTPQRSPLTVGIHDREGRKGRTGADAATILTVGVPCFTFAEGEVWGIHVGFSGNHRHYAERLSTGDQVVGGSELLLPGEIELARDEAYSTPWVYGAYGVGLDDQAARFHTYLRSRPQHPVTDRPVTLNVWEAVYFDHDEARLIDLAKRASRLGVERFVLDDGWFRHRRNALAGLGDWYVDETVWPRGLAPLVDAVRGAGMEFGLWFEPEMINADSDLARAHPEWIMSTGNRMPPESRHQQVLNLGIPEAFAYILDRITSLVRQYGIDYIKWDHNRDLVDAGGATGAPGVHAQTLAAYRLMQQLKERFPGLEIESCSSGGGRVDLGIIEHTDRVWVSDCIDPLERQQMNRWTMQLLPPELLGSHVGSGVNHVTGRSQVLSFRAGTALLGHFGIEWDLAAATEDELAELAEWIDLYKKQRPLLHSGKVVRVDQTDDTRLVYGVVRADRREALFFLASTGRADVSPRSPLTFRGLDPDLAYRVVPVPVGLRQPGIDPAPWWDERTEGIVLPGRVLISAGVQAPTLYPDHIVCFRLEAQ